MRPAIQPLPGRVLTFRRLLMVIVSLTVWARVTWAIPIDFESLKGSIHAPITDQFAASHGVIFGNAVILQSMVTLNEMVFPPHSGVAVAGVLDDAQPMVLTFLTPHSSISGWVSYDAPLTITAFDPAGHLLSTSNSVLGSAVASNEFFLITGIGPIGSIRIAQNAFNSGSSFTLDDLTAAPEPASVLLLGSGLASLLLRRSRRLRRTTSSV